MKTGLRYLFISVIVLIANASVAQVGNCDSLQLLDIQVNPFNAEQLVLRSSYSDFDNFISYPGFSVVDENLYILAQEEVNYFGMSTEQVHILDVFDMEIEAGESLEIDLELWSFFYEYLECVVPGPYTLLPEYECVPLRMTMNNFDVDSAAGNVSWNIVDDGGEVIISETMALDTMPELVHFDFCLPPGCGYSLDIETTEMIGEGMAYSMHYSDFLAVGVSGIFADADNFGHTFDLYDCLTTGSDDTHPEEFSMFPNPATNRVYFQFHELETNGSLCINDLTGREMIRIDNLNEPSSFIDCGHWPSGVYLVSFEQTQRQVATKKLVITR